jgi:hypothetical protein
MVVLPSVTFLQTVVEFPVPSQQLGDAHSGSQKLHGNTDVNVLKR